MTAEGEQITITEVEDYKNARPCLQNCLAGNEPLYGWRAPAIALTCSHNSCLCRPDLAPTAYTAIKLCMDNRCGNELEKDLASDIFSGYCAAYKATAPPYTRKVSTPATVTAVVSVEVTEAPTQVTITQTLEQELPVATTVANAIKTSSSATTQTSTPSTTSSTQTLPPTTIIPSPPSTTTRLVIAKEPEKPDRGDQIALGVGLSFGLLATVIGIAGLVLSWRGHKGPFKYRDHRGDVSSGAERIDV